jgi:RimJ/RimL family protein N-acetyltransferase
MEFKELSLSDCEQVRQWRNQVPEMLRTSFLLTKEMQEKFYHEVVCDRNARSRFWGLINPNKEPIKESQNYIIDKALYDMHPYELIGMAGLENIQHENQLAEISLILDPERTDFMDKALNFLLNKAFNELNLENVYTEVYSCNPHLDFWLNQHEKFNKDLPFIVLPSRKFYKGMYFNSFYINISRERYNESFISESTYSPD